MRGLELGPRARFIPLAASAPMRAAAPIRRASAPEEKIKLSFRRRIDGRQCRGDSTEVFFTLWRGCSRRRAAGMQEMKNADGARN
jgi:hypothetical protein